RKLILSIDVGTTFTAASFCLLQPGSVPKLQDATSDAKIPSVLYYDQHGNAKAFGAETEDIETIVRAEDDGWQKVIWWKLHLRPQHLPIIRDLELPPIPTNLSVDKVFADHFRYVKEQVRAYICSSYGSVGNIWEKLSPTMCVILTTPNGWEGFQQNRMRQAAIEAGLVDSDGGRRVRFVTEAEAAFLYTAYSGNIEDWLVKGSHLIVCDCGGGTVDITGYKVISANPTLKLEESAASRCADYYYAPAYFQLERLRGTKWCGEADIQRITDHFDCHAKKTFEGHSPGYVELPGDYVMTSRVREIKNGRLKITVAEMASFFEAPLQEIKRGIEIAIENGGRLADKVILVGGLASSPYVYSKLVAWGKGFHVSVIRPDGPTVKAVSNGALVWHLDDIVGSRISKYHYGTNVQAPYDACSAEHRVYVGQKFLEVDGQYYVDRVWDCIVEKDAKIQASKEFAEPFKKIMREDSKQFAVQETIYAYRGQVPPTFLNLPDKNTLQPGFEAICTVKGNLRRCFNATPTRVARSGVRLRTVTFYICLCLGGTEITARLRWKEEGKDVYGPATVTYD
ncbi:hypothetical protein GGX14DRAFT_634634, partial [Mycena pura]